MKRNKLPKVTSEIAQTVWALNSLTSKKSFLLEYIGDKYNTEEQATIRRRLEKMTKADDVDILVSNMMLKTDGLGVK